MFILIPQLLALGCRLWSGDSAPFDPLSRLPGFYLPAQRDEKAAHQTCNRGLPVRADYGGRAVMRRWYSRTCPGLYLSLWVSQREVRASVGRIRRLASRTMATLPQLDDRVIAFQASFRLLVNFIQADQMWGSAAAFSIKEPYGVTQEVWKGWRAEKRREIRGPWVTGGRIMNSLKTKMAAQLIEPDTSLKPNLTVCILVVCVCAGTQFQARAWSSFLWYWVIRNWEGVEQQLNRITKMSGERWQW